MRDCYRNGQSSGHAARLEHFILFLAISSCRAGWRRRCKGTLLIDPFLQGMTTRLRQHGLKDSKWKGGAVARIKERGRIFVLGFAELALERTAGIQTKL